MSRPTKIEIDLSALKHNFHVVRSYAPKQKIACCVKANAYGHSILEVSKCLAKHADALAVASIEEAISIRDFGIRSPILLLEGVFESSELELVSDYDLWMVIHNQRQLDWLVASDLGDFKTDVWLKFDTGMHRLGFKPEQASELMNELSLNKHVSNIRLMTHFARADEQGSSFTEQQLTNFNGIENSLGFESSLANSSAIIDYPESHKNWVRPGFMLYGLSPFGQNHESAKKLKPVMRFTTEIIDIKSIPSGEGVGYNHYWRASRDSRIAVLAVGYGDGYPRNTKNGAPVFLKGKIAKTVGHVAMDMMMVDVTDIETAMVGDVAELWGENISVNDLAECSGYSPYELLTRMPPRANRQFIS